MELDKDQLLESSTFFQQKHIDGCHLNHCQYYYAWQIFQNIEPFLKNDQDVEPFSEDNKIWQMIWNLVKILIRRHDLCT